MTKQFCIIGGGVMGETFSRALIANDLAAADAITICDTDARRRATLQQALGVATTESHAEAAAGALVIFLAVKPQDFSVVASVLQGRILPNQLVISIMAGVEIAQLRGQLGHRALARAMPNTPAQIGQGLTVWTATEEVDAEQRAGIQQMLATMGQELFVPDEHHIDMATAVSASGPGFVFLFLEAMIDGAVAIGMRRKLATEMVYQTVLGSAALAAQSAEHTALLRELVTSPGGTTAAGLLAMERHGVRVATIEAIIAAYERTRELGKQS